MKHVVLHVDVDVVPSCYCRCFFLVGSASAATVIVRFSFALVACVGCLSISMYTTLQRDSRKPLIFLNFRQVSLLSLVPPARFIRVLRLTAVFTEVFNGTKIRRPSNLMGNSQRFFSSYTQIFFQFATEKFITFSCSSKGTNIDIRCCRWLDFGSFVMTNKMCHEHNTGNWFSFAIFRFERGKCSARRIDSSEIESQRPVFGLVYSRWMGPVAMCAGPLLLLLYNSSVGPYHLSLMAFVWFFDTFSHSQHIHSTIISMFQHILPLRAVYSISRSCTFSFACSTASKKIATDGSIKSEQNAGKWWKKLVRCWVSYNLVYARNKYNASTMAGLVVVGTSNCDYKTISSEFRARFVPVVTGCRFFCITKVVRLTNRVYSHSRWQ